jgi:hypothetical protein
VVLATLTNDVATAFGLAAAAIAVCGFIAHVKPALSGADEQQLRRATLRGGIAGIVLATSVIVLSASTS